MKRTIKKLSLVLGLIGVMGLASEVKAYTQSQPLDIRVSINASKSLAVDTTFYNFGGLPISSSVVSASSITVTNDSGGLVETYTIQGASATPVGAGTNWALSAVAVGADTYMLSAVVNAGATPILANFVANDRMTFNAQACTTNVFSVDGAGTHGATVAPAAGRGLWFMIDTPSSVTDTVDHKATITLAVQ